MTMEDIEAREASIREEVKTEGADLEALETETRALQERKAELKAEIETRKASMEAVASGSGEEVEKTEERTIMTDMEIRNSAAYIDAYVNYIKTNDDTECRALLTTNASGGRVAVPELVEGIVRHAWEREGIMSRVKRTYLKGNLKIGFELSATGAAIHTEGAAAPSEETLTLGTVSIVPASIKKWITISDEVMDMRGEQFLEYVYNELAYQIAKKAADELVGKIVAAGTTSSSTQIGYPKVAASTIGMGTIATALGYLTDEATDPVIIMNKQTWADFKAVQYANGYGADPFEGLTVVFNSTLPSHSAAVAATTPAGTVYAIVGDLGNGALANFPGGEDIEFKFDELSLAEKDLVKIVGREYVGLGLVGPDQFVRLTL